MKTKLTYTLLAVIAPTLLLVGCHEQRVEPRVDPTEMVNVQFNTFLKEGEHISPMNGATKAATGTLSNGFYLYAYAHKLPFATSEGNSYIPIFENVKIGADGTFAIPKFWLEDKTLSYTFQAYAATAVGGAGVAPASVLSNGLPRYISSSINTTSLGSGYNTTDVLSASVGDLKLADNSDVSVNLYFEHRLCRLVFKVQRFSVGGPALENVKMSLVCSANGPFLTGSIKWTPTQLCTTTADRAQRTTSPLGTTFNIPAAEMDPIFVDDLFYGPQTLVAGWASIQMSYEVSGVQATIQVNLPAMTLLSGKQYDIVVGHTVESEQLVIQSVTLSDWVTVNQNVPVYK